MKKKWVELFEKCWVRGFEMNECGICVVVNVESWILISFSVFVARKKKLLQMKMRRNRITVKPSTRDFHTLICQSFSKTDMISSRNRL